MENNLSKSGFSGASFSSKSIFRVLEALVTVLMIVQLVMYFVQIGKLENDLLGYLASQIRDDYSIMGLLDDSPDEIFTLVTIVILGFAAVFSAIPVFTGDKMTAISLIAIAASIWNKVVFGIIQKEVESYIGQLESLGVGVETFPVFAIASTAAVGVIILSIIAMIIGKAEGK